MNCRCSLPSSNAEEQVPVRNNGAGADPSPVNIRGDDGDAKPVPRALGPDPGPEEPRRPRKRPQPMPISRGTTWADLRDFTHQDPSPVRPPGSRLEDISTLPATPATSPRVCEPKRKNQAGYSDICPSFPPSFSSSLPADLARMTVVWLDPAFARLALAPINPVNPSGRSLLCTYPASNGCSRCTQRRGDDGERTLSAKLRSLFFFSRRSLQLENDINPFRSALPLQLPHSTQHTVPHQFVPSSEPVPGVASRDDHEPLPISTAAPISTATTATPRRRQLPRGAVLD